MHQFHTMCKIVQYSFMEYSFLEENAALISKPWSKHTLCSTMIWRCDANVTSFVPVSQIIWQLCDKGPLALSWVQVMLRYFDAWNKNGSKCEWH